MNDIMDDLEKILEYMRNICDHECTSNCRKVGCNCTCGEFHDASVFAAVDRIEAHLATHEERIL